MRIITRKRLNEFAGASLSTSWLQSARCLRLDSPHRRRGRYADALRRISRSQSFEFPERRARSQATERASGYPARALPFIIEQFDQSVYSAFDAEMPKRVANRIDQIAVLRFAEHGQQILSSLSDIQILERADNGAQIVASAFAHIAQ